MLGNTSQGYIVLKRFRFPNWNFEEGRRENQSLGLIKGENCHDSREKTVHLTSKALASDNEDYGL